MVAVLERVEETKYEFDPVRFERKALVTVTYQVRWMARLRLGTPYPEVVRKVRARENRMEPPRSPQDSAVLG